jgi:hypothetical protein
MLLLAAGLLMCGCAASSEFSVYHGPDMTNGKGGTFRKVNGMDVWESGMPPEMYRVLGLLREKGSWRADYETVIENLVEEAKARGADAIVIFSRGSRTSGFGNATYRSPTVTVIALQYQGPLASGSKY